MENELKDELKTAFDNVLNRSWYIGGCEDKAFEEAFANYCGVDYCIGVGNGLDSLMLSLKALGIGNGDEVIVPSNTYIATALAVTQVGAIPVLVEPDINTFNINPRNIEERISEKTKAIMPVHLYGQACNMTKRQRNLIRAGVFFNLNWYLRTGKKSILTFDIYNEDIGLVNGL